MKRHADRGLRLMQPHTSLPGKNNWGLFLAMLALGLPSIVALFGSLALSHGGWGPASAVWFIYEVSRYFAYLGIVVSALIVVAEIRQASREFLVLMELSLVGAVLVLWYAAHIFRSPW